MRSASVAITTIVWSSATTGAALKTVRYQQRSRQVTPDPPTEDVRPS
jgi:hypothetical protein